MTKAINDPKIDACKDVTLLNELDRIQNVDKKFLGSLTDPTQQDFTSTLSNSKEAAFRGANLIEGEARLCPVFVVAN